MGVVGDGMLLLVLLVLVKALLVFCWVVVKGVFLTQVLQLIYSSLLIFYPLLGGAFPILEPHCNCVLE